MLPHHCLVKSDSREVLAVAVQKLALSGKTPKFLLQDVTHKYKNTAQDTVAETVDSITFYGRYTYM
jgi:hypothetical protein